MHHDPLITICKTFLFLSEDKKYMLKSDILIEGLKWVFTLPCHYFYDTSIALVVASLIHAYQGPYYHRIIEDMGVLLGNNIYKMIGNMISLGSRLELLKYLIAKFQSERMELRLCLDQFIDESIIVRPQKLYIPNLVTCANNCIYDGVSEDNSTNEWLVHDDNKSHEIVFSASLSLSLQLSDNDSNVSEYAIKKYNETQRESSRL